MKTHLNVAVVLDYQNMLTTAHTNFKPDAPRSATYLSLLDPSKLADTIAVARDRSRAELFGDDYEPGPPLRVSEIVVARGMPDAQYAPELHRYSTAHAAKWSEDPRVRMITPPMTYRVWTRSDGEKYMRGMESGVDTTVALEALCLSRRSDLDVVIVATHDHDVDPGVLYARRLGTAYVETAGWEYANTATRTADLCDDAGRSVWRTFLTEADFHACRDRTDY